MKRSSDHEEKRKCKTTREPDKNMWLKCKMQGKSAANIFTPWMENPMHRYNLRQVKIKIKLLQIR